MNLSSIDCRQSDISLETLSVRIGSFFFQYQDVDESRDIRWTASSNLSGNGLRISTMIMLRFRPPKIDGYQDQHVYYFGIHFRVGLQRKRGLEPR